LWHYYKIFIAINTNKNNENINHKKQKDLHSLVKKYLISPLPTSPNLTLYSLPSYLSSSNLDPELWNPEIPLLDFLP
jgi:hypothetical protein